MLSLLAGMIRIWKLSGQELPAVSTEEISNVLDLKASLRSLHGFPMCVQRVLHNGNSLDNSTKLDVPIGLQLVLLAFSTEEQQAEAAKELAESCGKGDLKVARLLLEAGASKNAEDGEGNTVLMLAAQSGHVEIVRLLLEADADKDLLDSNGCTALMLSAEKGHVKTARLLLQAGANKDRQDRKGNTALMLTADNDHVETARLAREDRTAAFASWCL